MIEIVSRYDSSKVLYTAKNATDVRSAVIEAVRADANLADANLADANLADANLADANLARAYLAGANLAGANLAGANLARANLARAYLARANLADANLARAYLAGAKGINPLIVSPLHVLLDQVGKIRAYKLVSASGMSPIHPTGALRYIKGETVEVKTPNCDPNQSCGAGINVATMDWILRNRQSGQRVLVVEFTAKDIACIPTATDGKFRLHRCKVVGEKTPEQMGLES